MLFILHLNYEGHYFISSLLSIWVKHTIIITTWIKHFYILIYSPSTVAYFNPYEFVNILHNLKQAHKNKQSKVKVCFLVGYIYGYSYLRDFEGNCRNLFTCSKNINIDAVELDLYTESTVDIILVIQGKRLYLIFILTIKWFVRCFIWIWMYM